MDYYRINGVVRRRLHAYYGYGCRRAMGTDTDVHAGIDINFLYIRCTIQVHRRSTPMGLYLQCRSKVMTVYLAHTLESRTCTRVSKC